METDADVSIADIRGCTALHFAASSDDDGRSVRVFVKCIALSQFAVCDEFFVFKMNWCKYLSACLVVVGRCCIVAG